jgi:hypothetical protein
VAEQGILEFRDGETFGSFRSRLNSNFSYLEAQIAGTANVATTGDIIETLDTTDPLPISAKIGDITIKDKAMYVYVGEE